MLQALHFLKAFLMKYMTALSNAKSPFLKSKLRLRFRYHTVLVMIKFFIAKWAYRFIFKSGIDAKRAFIVGLAVLIVFSKDKKGSKR